LWKCPENASLSIVISVWEIEKSLLEPNLASKSDGEALLLVFLRQNEHRQCETVHCHAGETIPLNCEIRDGRNKFASVTVPLHLNRTVHSLFGLQEQSHI
jgi:hypothetical protein